MQLLSLLPHYSMRPKTATKIHTLRTSQAKRCYMWTRLFSLTLILPEFNLVILSDKMFSD